MTTSGELAFIKRLRTRLPSGPPGQIWLGDDAAVLADGQLLKTDVLVETTHFDLAWCEPADAGWKALAVNLSDIAAMGGTPTAAVVSLVVRSDQPGVGDRAMEGMAEASARFNCPIVGGDTAIGPALVLAVTVLGRAPAAGAVLRGGARAGDAIFVTGQLGAAGHALGLLQAGRTAPTHATCLHRPIPRLAEGAAAAAAGATAMIDLSDGLATDLGHLCAESSLAATVDLDRLPVPEAVDPESALVSGDDYELLFTGPAGLEARLRATGREPVTRIGTMVEGRPAITVHDRNGSRPLLARAWEHDVPFDPVE